MKTLRNYSAYLITAFLCILFSKICIAASEKIEYVGSALWSGIRDVTVSGNYAYCAFRYGLGIIDVSNPTVPIIASTLYLDPYIENIEVAENFAYLSGSQLDDIFIVDVSNPRKPTLIKRAHYAHINALRYNKDYVILSDTSFSIVKFDNSGNPIILGHSHTSSWTMHIEVADKMAIASSRSEGITIYDISNPHRPQILSQMIMAGDANASAIKGKFAYVAVGGLGIQIVDLSNPVVPVICGKYDLEGSILGISIIGDYAYVADRYLSVLDISNPKSPKLVNRDFMRNALGIFTMKDRLYAFNEGSVQIFDIKNHKCPNLMGKYLTPGSLNHISVIDSIAYIFAESGLLYIVDIKTPQTPKVVNTFKINATACDLSEDEKYAYITCANDGLSILDISDPINPKKLNQITTKGWASDINVIDSIAIITNYDKNILILDVANPLIPRYLAQYDNSISPRKVAIKDNFLYIADGKSGLVVINIADIIHPVENNNYKISSISEAISVSDHFVYISDNEWGISVFDINNPMQVRLNNEIPIRSNGTCIRGVGPYIFGDNIVICKPDTLGIPNIIYSYNLSLPPSDISIWGQYALITDQDGFFIISLPPSIVRTMRAFVPANYYLYDSYQLNDEGKIDLFYDLPRDSKVLLTANSIAGSAIDTIICETKKEGTHKAEWNCSSAKEGDYICKIRSGAYKKEIKIELRR
jgi:hypothetical protein